MFDSQRLPGSINSDNLPRLPRTLLLGWSLWLLASWTQAFFLYLWKPGSTESYGLAVQYLLFSAGLGIAVIWPMYRLGFGGVQRPIRVVLLDLIALISTLQVVVWPMRLLMPWTMEKIIALDAFLMVWALLIGAVISFFLHFDRTLARSTGMLCCLVLSMSAPTLFVLSGSRSMAAAQELLHWSPVSGAWIMGRRSDAHPPLAEWWRLAFIGAAAMLCWMAVFLAEPPEPTTLPPVKRSQDKNTGTDGRGGGPTLRGLPPLQI